MKVKYSDLLKLFDALKIPTARDWDQEKMATKVKRIKTFAGPDTEIKDAKLAKLFEDLSAAEGEVEIEGFGAKPAAAAKKGGKPAAAKKTAAKKPAGKKPAAAKKAGKKKPAARTQPRGSGEWYKDFANNPLELTDRGPGIIRNIVSTLEDAGRKKTPLTIDKLHERLTKLFKDRDPQKLRATLRNQVPSRLRLVRGIHVWKRRNEKTGNYEYWIEGDGTKAQPKAVKEKPSARAAGEGTKPAAGSKKKKKGGKKADAAA